MTALYFLGLSMQYSIEQASDEVEEGKDNISPEQFAGSIRKFEADDSKESND
jgi:hypothetical protein